MQLQILKLEDGEYAKANGGFSLVRAGVKKVAPAISTATTSVGAGRSECCSIGAYSAHPNTHVNYVSRRNHFRRGSPVCRGERREFDQAHFAVGQEQKRDAVFPTDFQQGLDQDGRCQCSVRCFILNACVTSRVVLT